MSPAIRALAASVVLVGSSGCAVGGGSPLLTNEVLFDVGGIVVFADDDEIPIADATITLVDVDGKDKVATSEASGLWTASNLHPGVWRETISAPGYEPLVRHFELEIEGANDVANVFDGRPDALLFETRLRASAAPFSVEVKNGETLMDPFDGVSMVYSKAAHGSIVVTMSRAMIDLDGYFYDFETGDFIFGTFDSVANTLSFPEADINGMTNGLTTDSDPYTWCYLDLYGWAKTPIHGFQEDFSATLYVNAVP